MIIRQATPDDFPAIWPLLRATFRAGDTYAVDPEIDEAAARAYWIDTAAATYLAEDEGEVLGTYYIRTNQPGGGAHVCNCGYITATAARGRGVARAMCLHSQTEALQLGYAAMQFNFVLATNVAALGLWKKLGFEVVGQLPRAFAHPREGLIDAFVLYKWLAD